MKRITVEEVKAAYEKTGLKPVRGTFNDGKGCGCALGALYMAQGGAACCSDPEEWCDAEFDFAYWDGFAGGFDAKEDFSLPDYVSLSRKEGHADGRAVAAAIFGEPANV